MNEDDQGKINENDSDYSDDETKERKAQEVMDRRRMYYEKKMAKRKAKVKGNFDFGKELQELEDNKPKNGTNGDSIPSQMKFIKVKVHTRIGSSEFNAKSENDKDLIHLVGEIEISDKLKFKELLPKSAKMFNSQLTDKGYDIKISNSPEKSKFKFAKNSGEPDLNFPCFDETQKVSDCGVTKICLVVDLDELEYIKSAPISRDVPSAKAPEVEVKPQENGLASTQENGNPKQGSIKKKGKRNSEERDVSRLDKTNSSCKCIIF